MIERSRIADVISLALRDVQSEIEGVDLSNAILLIDQGILHDSPSIPDILGFKVYSAGYISHISEAMLAFPEEATEKHERFMHKFISAMQVNDPISVTG